VCVCVCVRVCVWISRFVTSYRTSIHASTWQYNERLGGVAARGRRGGGIVKRVFRSVCKIKGEGRPYSITERSVPELIPVLGSQPARDVSLSHKPGGRLPLLSARPAVTPATLERAAINFAAW